VVIRYKKWDDIKRKIGMHEHELTNYIIDQYEKFTYSVAFARNEKYHDPWNDNYVLKYDVLNNDGTTKKTDEFSTEDRAILPYGECFAYGQKLNDNKDYSIKFSDKEELINFIEDCIELGSYTYEIHQDLLVNLSNFLAKFVIDEQNFNYDLKPGTVYK
jgi:hypothetical protein